MGESPDFPLYPCGFWGFCYHGVITDLSFINDNSLIIKFSYSIPFLLENSYFIKIISSSKDKNLWHLSHEGLDLEDPANEPQYEKEGFLELGVSPIQAPDKPTYVTIHFEKGIPTAIDGKELGAVELVEKLNELGGANGIGLADLVENRLVGMKSRGVYETPGGLSFLCFSGQR